MKSETVLLVFLPIFAYYVAQDLSQAQNNLTSTNAKICLVFPPFKIKIFEWFKLNSTNAKILFSFSFCLKYTIFEWFMVKAELKLN